jgi:hypothetical protein
LTILCIDLSLVVSATQVVVYVLKGHDFSRAINGAKRAGL